MKLYYHCLIIFIFSLCACNRVADSPYPDVQWEKKSNLPINGLVSARAASVEDKAYVFFGRVNHVNNSYGTYSKDCWEYDATNDIWTKKSPCPGKARVNPIAITLNGKIYTGLGYGGEGVTNNKSHLTDFWMYDPATDLWEKKADYPNYETNGCICFIHENKIYVGFGFHELNFGASLMEYDPEKDEWNFINSYQEQFRALATCCFDNDHIFMGTGYKTYNLNDWWQYTPSNDSWKKCKDMPDNGRQGAVSLCIKNRFFVSSGRYFRGDQTGGHLKSDVLEYDATRNVWYKRGDIPTDGRENAIAFTINGKGYIGLGENMNNALNDLWCFEP